MVVNEHASLLDEIMSSSKKSSCSPSVRVLLLFIPSIVVLFFTLLFSISDNSLLRSKSSPIELDWCLILGVFYALELPFSIYFNFSKKGRSWQILFLVISAIAFFITSISSFLCGSVFPYNASGVSSLILSVFILVIIMCMIFRKKPLATEEAVPKSCGVKCFSILHVIIFLVALLCSIMLTLQMCLALHDDIENFSIHVVSVPARYNSDGSPMDDVKNIQVHFSCYQDGQYNDDAIEGSDKYDDAPTVILNHSGNGNSAAEFREIQDLMTSYHPRINVCVYDRPGFGFSQLNPYINEGANIDPDEYSHMLMAAIEAGEAQNDNGYVLVGHGDGGDISLQTHRLYPDDIKGVLLLDVYCFKGECNIEMIWAEAGGMADPVEFEDHGLQDRDELINVINWFAPLGSGWFVSNNSPSDSMFDVQADTYEPSDLKSYYLFTFHRAENWYTQYNELKAIIDYDWESSHGLEISDTWTVANQTDIPLLVIGAGLQDTCADRGIDEDSDDCTYFTIKQQQSYLQMQAYAATSTIGIYRDCAVDKCTHNFVWAHGFYCVELISGFVDWVMDPSNDAVLYL
ncbi:hypothetical protein ADUPG1_013515 [Aduncisulcus paluster]|uniref:AB hydrolase-1 domain-containing protein n=1 Tax=Aduncisulcus paluster TaxID=2918883 RepID=A0ABQ5K6G6_9EUKA|nr:hypothetical protein ADUPG1_013515 [Aduncisulcus paluster]